MAAAGQATAASSPGGSSAATASAAELALRLEAGAASPPRHQNGGAMCPIPMLPLHVTVGSEREYVKALDVLQKKPIYSVEMQKNRLQCRDGKSTQLFGGNATRGQVLAVALGITHADLQRERLLELATRPLVGVYQVAEVLPSCCIVARSLQRNSKLAAQSHLPEPDEDLTVNPNEPSRHICLRQICPGLAGAALGFVLRRRIEGRLPSDKKNPFWAPGFRGRRRSADTRRDEDSEDEEEVPDDADEHDFGEEDSLRVKPLPTRLRRPRRASEAAAGVLTASGEKHSKNNGLKSSQHSTADDSTDSAAAAAAAAERALPIRKRRSHSMGTNGHAHNHSPASPIPLSGSGEVEQIIASLAKKARNGMNGVNGSYGPNGMNGGGMKASGESMYDEASKHMLRDLEAKIVMLNEQLTKETRDHIEDMRKHLDAVRSTQASLTESLLHRASLQKQVGELEAACQQHRALTLKLQDDCERLRKELSKHGLQPPPIEEAISAVSA